MLMPGVARAANAGVGGAGPDARQFNNGDPRAGRGAGRQIGQVDTHAALPRQNRGALDHVLQFPHIAREIVAPQRLQGTGRQGKGFATQGGAEGVGRATTRAVVLGCQAILVLDAFWALVLL